MINITKLHKELINAGIKVNGCSVNGIVWDDDNNDISKRADVAAIIAAHDPTPEPLPPTLEEELIAIKAELAAIRKAAPADMKIAIEAELAAEVVLKP